MLPSAVRAPIAKKAFQATVALERPEHVPSPSARALHNRQRHPSGWRRPRCATPNVPGDTPTGTVASHSPWSVRIWISPNVDVVRHTCARPTILRMKSSCTPQAHPHSTSLLLPTAWLVPSSKRKPFSPLIWTANLVSTNADALHPTETPSRATVSTGQGQPMPCATPTCLTNLRCSP